MQHQEWVVRYLLTNNIVALIMPIDICNDIFICNNWITITLRKDGWCRCSNQEKLALWLLFIVKQVHVTRRILPFCLHKKGQQLSAIDRILVVHWQRETSCFVIQQPRTAHISPLLPPYEMGTPYRNLNSTLWTELLLAMGSLQNVLFDLTSADLLALRWLFQHTHT